MPCSPCWQWHGCCAAAQLAQRQARQCTQQLAQLAWLAQQLAWLAWLAQQLAWLAWLAQQLVWLAQRLA